MDDFLFILSAAVFYASLTAVCAVNLVHFMHMFQLNSYNAKEQLHWMRGNISDIVVRHIFTPIAIIIYLTVSAGSLPAYAVTFIISAVLLLNIVFPRRKAVKKKLVFTPRVIRMCVCWTVLFAAAAVIPLCCAGFGMTAVLTALCLQLLNMLGVIIANFVNKPVEHGINLHYINDAKRIINSMDKLTVVGITGSYGKTSTKFYLEKLLSAKYNVLMTPESYNTTMGVVKTVRNMLGATHEIFICEMGAKNVGEIKEICDIVKPRHGIITSIGPQHLETFKSIENIIATKFELADSLPDGGVIVLNFDNEYIRNSGYKRDKLTYGLAGGDYYADNISVSERGTAFTVHCKDGSREFSTRLIGENNVQNILGAIAMANMLGISLDELVMPVRRLECVPHRLQIINNGGNIIIDDAFNSNPTGAKAALDTLKLFDGYRILITPGMIELGEKEYELNKAFGAQAAAACDFCIAVGEKQAVPITDGLKSAGYPPEKMFVAQSLKEAMDKASGLDAGGRKKIILLENDLPDNY